MSEMLKKARAYEAEKAAQTDKNTRPLFHISAPAGWINDPNGFSIYDGKIHLFYQYYPYAREWGPMHWLTISLMDKSYGVMAVKSH